MLDDHRGCLRVAKRKYQLYTQCTTDTPARDLETFATADQWYADAGFRSNFKKRQTRSVVVSSWGAKSDGVVYLVGAIRAETCRLPDLFRLSKWPANELILSSVLGILCGCPEEVSSDDLQRRCF